MDPMDETAGQGELLMDAIERSGKPRKAVAAEIGAAYQTLDGWMREDRRVPIRAWGLLCKVIGPWFLNQILEPHGFKVVRLYPTSHADVFESVREAALRLGGASGKVTSEIADATAPGGPGGQAITTTEAAEIRSSISEAEAYLAVMKERLDTATGTN